jgi:hypothetical protein
MGHCRPCLRHAQKGGVSPSQIGFAPAVEVLTTTGLVPGAARPYNPWMIDTYSPGTLRRVVAAAVLTFASLGSGMALADDSSAQAQKGALPGVSGDYRIAKPVPQPEPDDAFPSNGNGTFKIGDTDVRISGTITVDMATGGFKPPR